MATQLITTYSSRNSANRVGDAAANTKQAQSFIVGHTGTITPTQLYPDNTPTIGSPSDGLTVTIEADSAGFPSGTPLASVNISAATWVAGAGGLITITWGSPPSVTNGTTYWQVIKRQGALDASNYYRIGADSASTYPDGKAATFDGSSWADDPDGGDLCTTVTVNYNPTIGNFLAFM